LNSMKVGMPRTPYFDGVIGFSSMFNLATVTRVPSSASSASSAGPISQPLQPFGLTSRTTKCIPSNALVVGRRLPEGWAARFLREP
jgi:hypothetical protein